MNAEAIQDIFIRRQWTLSVAESCTGGAIAACLTKVAGASQYFLGGVVSYSSGLKEKIVGVPHRVLSVYGPFSKETAGAMALGIIQAAGSDFGLAVSGVAGPSGGTPDTPVGAIWIAVARKGKPPHCLQIQASGDREAIIAQGVASALETLLRYAQQET